MKKYYRIMLGRRSAHVELCRKESFIGADFSMQFSFEGNLPENWRDFNKHYIPKLIKRFLIFKKRKMHFCLPIEFFE